MSPWITALLTAVLLATVPLTWIFRILRNLPPPLLAFPSPMAGVGELRPHRSDHGERDGVRPGRVLRWNTRTACPCLTVLDRRGDLLFRVCAHRPPVRGVVSGVLRDHGTNRTRHSQSPIPQRCRYRRDERIRRRNADCVCTCKQVRVFPWRCPHVTCRSFMPLSKTTNPPYEFEGQSAQYTYLSSPEFGVLSRLSLEFRPSNSRASNSP